MNTRDTPLALLVIAASSGRRAALAEMAARTARARVSAAAGISSHVAFQNAVDLLLVDVDTPALADALIRMSEDLPRTTGTIALIDHPEPRWVARALNSGINAILARSVSAEELGLAIMAAEAGMVLLHPSSAQGFTANSSITHEDADPVESLTSREQQVLRLVSEGLGNREIAGRLNISEHTVKFHISSILGKLGATSRAEAVSRGIRRGFIAI